LGCTSVPAPKLLEALKRIEDRDAKHTAKRARQRCSKVFRYAISTGRAEHDIAASFADALAPSKAKNFASIKEPKAIGALLRDIDAYTGNLIVRAALRMAPYVFVRPGELRKAEWAEFNFEGAEWRISSDKLTPNHVSAASYYENAIQIYRTIPRAERAVHRVDERIVELRKCLNDSGERAMGEMSEFQTPVDITQRVESARNAVTGKSAQEALLEFVSLYHWANAEEFRKSIMSRMQRFPMQFLFGATMMSCGGRVIAKRPAARSFGQSTEDDEVVIRAEMVRDYSTYVSLRVQGSILPALEVLLFEHRLRKADFIGLARQSPIVPKDRSRLWGKALFAGYERDFASSLHLLIPQIENMVRVHLKQAGALTTSLDKYGIQNENGMSTLMELPEVDQVFGRDVAFELRALSCDAAMNWLTGCSTKTCVIHRMQSTLGGLC